MSNCILKNGSFKVDFFLIGKKHKKAMHKWRNKFSIMHGFTAFELINIVILDPLLRSQQVKLDNYS